MRYFLLTLVLIIGCQGKEDKSPQSVAADMTGADAEAAPTAIAAGLPQGISPLTSVEATVSGTAAEYKYALRSGLGECASDSYGSFQSLSTKLSIGDLGADGIKTVCIIGKSSTGKEAQPKLHQWQKSTADPEEEVETPPEVTVRDVRGEYSQDRIELEIATKRGATHYQFAGKTGMLDCEDDFVDSDWSEERAVTADDGTFSLDLSDEPLDKYTLCLQATDGDGDVVQEETFQERFTVISPPPPESAGMLEITTSEKPTAIYFPSASSSHDKIILSNKGGSELEWKIEAESDASWLKIGVAKNDMQVVASATAVTGTLAAGEEDAVVWVRLADRYKTDYPAGKKTAKLKVYNVSGGDDPVVISVVMRVPAVSLSVSPVGIPGAKIIALSANNPKGRVILHNSDGDNWAVKYQFKHMLHDAEFEKFRDIVSYERSKTDDGKHTKFIEFSVNKAKLAQQADDYTYAMFYRLISNSSTQGTTSSCTPTDPEGGKVITVAKHGNVTFRPEFTTNVCYYFAVSLRK